MNIQGVSDECVAYSQQVNYLLARGQRFKDFQVAAVDFSEWSEDQIDGLLGIDLLQKLNFRFLGPERTVIAES